MDEDASQEERLAKLQKDWAKLKADCDRWQMKLVEVETQAHKISQEVYARLFQLETELKALRERTNRPKVGGDCLAFL